MYTSDFEGVQLMALPIELTIWLNTVCAPEEMVVSLATGARFSLLTTLLSSQQSTKRENRGFNMYTHVNTKLRFWLHGKKGKKIVFP